MPFDRTNSPERRGLDDRPLARPFIRPFSCPFDLPVDRRSLLAKAALAFGAAAATAALSGCELLGIEDPSVKKAEEKAAEEAAKVPGTVDFDDMTVILDLDQSTWEWGQLTNAASADNGSVVVGIPAAAVNNSDSSRVLNYTYCKIVAPNGAVQSDISKYYSNDIFKRGAIASGSSNWGTLHVVYRGEGTYTIQFDNLLGSKASLALEITGVTAAGVSAIPDVLSATDAGYAIASGESFDVGNLTLQLSADTTGYWWTQTWDDESDTWNGRWVVGVPVTVTNHSTEAGTVTADMYGMFAPGLYRLADPAPYFADSAVGYLGSVAPGASVSKVMYWVYDEDGLYYVVFDSHGARVVASVVISQY